MPRKQIDLDALVFEDGADITINGQKHAVRPIPMATFDTFRQAHASKDAGAIQEALFTVVRRVVPTLSAEEIADLTARQVNAIIDLSLGEVTEVRAATEPTEGADPNATGPATSPPLSTSPA